MSFSVTKQVKNTMKRITLDYQARRFNVVTTFGDGAFEHLTDWMRSELHITLTICVADPHVPRPKNAIRFMKGKPRSIQCEIVFRK